MIDAQNATSTRPYLIRALYEWCTDNGFTPYVAVMVDDSVQVPREYVKDGEIVLNISFDATSSLKLGNDFIEFKARFAGVAREIMVPVNRVIAVYARETGQGMAFPLAETPRGRAPAADGAHGGLAPVETGKEEDSQGEGAAAGKHIQLAPVEGGDTHAPPDGHEPPDPPRPPPSSRPTLTRIK
jgi:stringent starvation protein B